jgi:hypothetical protein
MRGFQIVEDLLFAIIGSFPVNRFAASFSRSRFVIASLYCSPTSYSNGKIEVRRHNYAEEKRFLC